MAVGAVAVLVDVRHEGFTHFARRLPIEPSLSITAHLDAATETLATASNTVSISGATTNGFTLQLTEDNQDKPSLSISIPASALPAGTQSLTAAVKAYDPNDAEQAQFFPGSYADSTGNGLVSVAFNFAEVKTDAGESLKTLAENAQRINQAPQSVAFAAAAEPVIINRAIPSSSCDTLQKLGDSNSELPGFQIPVYTYNPRSGLWDLLGYGTVYTEAGAAIAADGSDLNCTTVSYILEIKVSNQIFLSEWWNLDYPLAFTEPKRRCVSLRVVNEENEPVVGIAGLLSGAGNFSSQYFVTDALGNATVNVDVLSDENTTAQYSIWGGGTATGSVTVASACPAQAVQTIIIKRPKICKIKGKIQDYFSIPLAYLSILAVSEETSFFDYQYAYGATNAEGLFSIDVACNTNYQVLSIVPRDQNDPYVNVNGEVGADEISDNGKEAYVRTTTFTFYTTLIPSYQQSSQEGVLTFYGLYSAFPISYDLQLKHKTTGEILTSAKGILALSGPTTDPESGLWFLQSGEVRVPIVLPDDLSPYLIVGSHTDRLGNRTEVIYPLAAPAEELK